MLFCLLSLRTSNGASLEAGQDVVMGRSASNSSEETVIEPQPPQSPQSPWPPVFELPRPKILKKQFCLGLHNEEDAETGVQDHTNSTFRFHRMFNVLGVAIRFAFSQSLSHELLYANREKETSLFARKLQDVVTIEQIMSLATIAADSKCTDRTKKDALLLAHCRSIVDRKSLEQLEIDATQARFNALLNGTLANYYR